MLYILFGRDKIGKKSVRDFIAKKYGLIIIPKFTSDERKKWTIYNNFSENRQVIDPFYISEEEKFKNAVRVMSQHRDYTFCSATDESLLYRMPKEFEDETTRTGYKYDIKKVYQHKYYIAKYYIKEEHIDTSIKNNKDYLLVCSSGKVIEEIRDRAKVLNKENNVSIIQVIGEQHGVNSNSRWETEDDLPKYLFENLHKFSGTINNKKYYGNNGSIDRVLFEKNISHQWESITGMMPLKPKVFFVRPFSDKKNLTNINDSFEEEIQKQIKDLTNVDLEYLMLKESVTDNNFTAMANALEESNLIFVDLREYRPNCIYECGYARALTNFYNSKKVFTFIGIEVENESEYCEKKIKDDLSDFASNLAYDLTPYAYFKYVITKKFDASILCWKASIEFISESTATKNFENEIKKVLANTKTKQEIDIYCLIKSKE